MRHVLTGMLLAVLACGSGCMQSKQMIVPPPDGSVPTELGKATLPPYMIEPPDILDIVVLVPPTKPQDSPYSTNLPPQPVSGQFLVRPDGSVGLGIYGSVQVAGLTMDQARERIKEFMAKAGTVKAEGLQVSVDVAAYNSKVYYVITDGAGFGEEVHAFPITGSETVLDAMGRIGGIPAVGSKRHVWVARRSPKAGCTDQILPVDWEATAMRGETTTNYQVLPGDRIYVQSQCLISVDNALAKILSPVERIFGIVLLGSSTVNNVNGRFGNSGTGGN